LCGTPEISTTSPTSLAFAFKRQADSIQQSDGTRRRS
jgi:hypothetical protein